MECQESEPALISANFSFLKKEGVVLRRLPTQVAAFIFLIRSSTAMMADNRDSVNQSKTVRGKEHFRG